MLILFVICLTFIFGSGAEIDLTAAVIGVATVKISGIVNAPVATATVLTGIEIMTIKIPKRMITISVVKIANNLAVVLGIILASDDLII